jgi:cytochrome c-type biogenesis protein CcmH/NrfF
VRRAAVLLVALAALTAPAAAAAAQGCPKTSLGDIEDEVMCPVCGTPLAVATDAPQAQRERAYVERLIAQCQSKDQIKRALVAQFGDRVLALPGDEGSGSDLKDVLVYVVPAAAILAALGGVTLAWLRWRRRHGPTEPTPAVAADSGRLDADMERYDL